MNVTYVTLPDVTFLKECFSYDPETGDFRWKERPRNHFATERGWKIFNKRFAGAKAGGSRQPDHFHQVGLVGVIFSVPRIIYKMMTGEDLNVSMGYGRVGDLRWSNLQKLGRDSSLGCGEKHIYPRKIGKAFVVMIRGIYHGSFDTLQEAMDARCSVLSQPTT